MRPVIGKNVYISRTATVSGNVQIENDVSVWPGVSIRADINRIFIGARSNVQDNAIIHTSFSDGVHVGNDVSIAHGAVIHGCTIKNNCVIGIGAIILEGAVIEENCIVGPGSIVGKGKHIMANSLVMGQAGEIVKEITPEEIEHLKKNVQWYVDLKNQYLEQESKKREHRARPKPRVVKPKVVAKRKTRKKTVHKARKKHISKPKTSHKAVHKTKKAKPKPKTKKKR